MYLGFLCLASYPAAMYFSLTYPYWGRRKRINPRRTPEANPPICAKLSTPSTPGMNPKAKFRAITEPRAESDVH